MFGYANFCWLCRSFLSIHLHQFNEFVNSFIHILLLQKNYLFLTWWCFVLFFCGVLFYKGSSMSGGEILMALKWKQELKFNIFLIVHSRSFILESGLVRWLGCYGSFYIVIAARLYWPICFHLGAWTMFNDISSIHNWKLLLFQGFKSCVFCLSRTTLWERGPNPTH